MAASSVIEGATAPPAGQVARVDRGRAPWARWAIALLLADWLLIVANSDWLATDLRENGPPFPAQASELIWVQATAIVLGLLVAAPLLGLAAWLAHRTNVGVRALPIAVALGMFVFLVSSRLNTGIVLATGMLSWAADWPFDPTAVILAPILEEPAKAAAIVAVALLVRRRSRFGVREGIVAGTLVGLGANAIEAGVYVQLAYAGGHGAIYGSIIALRFGVFGFGLHAATSALMGAAIGAVLTFSGLRRVRVVGAAFAGAVTTHVVWNLVASRLVFEVVARIGPPPDHTTDESISQPILWIAATAVDLLLVSPIFVILVVAWRRSARSGREVDGDALGQAPASATADVELLPAPLHDGELP